MESDGEDDARSTTPSFHADAKRTLPDDWQRVYSRSTGNYYYYNCFTGKSTWDFPSEEPNAATTPTSMRARLGEIETELLEARTLLSHPAAGATILEERDVTAALSFDAIGDGRAAKLLADELANILEFINSNDADQEPQISPGLASGGNEMTVMLAEQIYKSVSELKRQESTSSRLLQDALILLEQQRLASQSRDHKTEGKDGQEGGNGYDGKQSQSQKEGTMPVTAESTRYMLGGDASTNEAGVCFETEEATKKVVSMSEHLEVLTLNQQLQEELSRYRLQIESRRQEDSGLSTLPTSSAPRVQQLFMPEIDGFDNVEPSLDSWPSASAKDHHRDLSVRLSPPRRPISMDAQSYRSPSTDPRPAPRPTTPHHPPSRRALVDTGGTVSLQRSDGRALLAMRANGNVARDGLRELVQGLSTPGRRRSASGVGEAPLGSNYVIT